MKFLRRRIGDEDESFRVDCVDDNTLLPGTADHAEVA